MKRSAEAYLALFLLLLGVLVSCSSPPVDAVEPKTAALIKTIPAMDWDQVHTGQTILYWREGELWRSAADGSTHEQLTQERLFDQWFPPPGGDPYWIGGPPPQPSISPDGRWLVASVDGSKFAIIDLLEVEPVRQYPSSAQAFSWSPDSRYFAYGRDKINVFDMTAGELLAEPTRRPGDVADIVWSADGLEIAFACCWRPNEQQPGEEEGEIYRYRLASAEAERAGETWRGIASGTPGLCWEDGRPLPADEAADKTHCSPKRLLPIADLAGGLWRAELGGYEPEENKFTEILVSEMTSGQERHRLDLSMVDDVQRIFWIEDGEALLLGSSWPGAAIYRLNLDADGKPALIVNDGVPYGVIPQWDLPPSP